MKIEWEIIHDHPQNVTSRAKVIGGWVLHSLTSNPADTSCSESMVFIPDTNHRWVEPDECYRGHTKIMFNKCFSCGEELEGYNRELHEAYLRNKGMNNEQVVKFLGVKK